MLPNVIRQLSSILFGKTKILALYLSSVMTCHNYVLYFAYHYFVFIVFVLKHELTTILTGICLSNTFSFIFIVIFNIK
jgi:hypothetical protein